jgi:hypothetical protein
MKKVLLISIAILILFTACGKIKEAKKTMDAVKKVSEMGKDMVETSKHLEDLEIEKVKLQEKDVKKFFKAIKSVEEKYPDIHFQVAAMAVIEANMAGKDLKEIVTKEMDLSFEEYSKLSAVITYATAVGAGYEMSMSIYNQMIESEETLKQTLAGVLSDEEKAELETQIAEVKKSIEELEEEMKKEEFVILKKNYEIIKKVNEELDM